MGRYLIGRFIKWVPSAVIVLFLVYALAFYGAGDPIKLIFLRAPGDVVWSPEQIEALREEAGLDRPFLIQFGDYFWHLLQGNLGNSIISNRPVIDIISAAAPISIQIGLAATAIMAIIGIPLGVLAGLYQNSWLDNVTVGFALFVWAIPVYVAGPLLLVLLVLVLKIMQVPYGWDGLFSTKAIIPVVVLALAPLALVIRQTRVAVIDVISEDYIRTAYAKGIPQYVVVYRHILRPVLTPVITTLGLIMITMINGAILVETVFGIPGLGYLTVNSIIEVDYPVILAITLIGTFLVMASNLLVDLVYPILDPRAAKAEVEEVG
jgi:ABC-type dipeptide/oligopeptide/nickel transport system permease component